MATASELIANVRRLIQDDSYGDEIILGFLNEGITEIAAWDNDDPKLGLVGNILLPALETSAVVTTSLTDPFVSLPANYGKNLYKVTFADQVSPIDILSNMRVMLEQWDDALTHEGPVEDVTVVGGRLYYQPIPTEATELTLWFYRLPTLLANFDPSGENTGFMDSGDTTFQGDDDTGFIDALSDDIPNCLPDHLHKSLLVSYAAKEIFNEIEDGIEGRKINTERYEGKYQQALTALYLGIKHKSKQIPMVRRHAHFF